MPDSRHQILLAESDQPTRWYNVLHDLPTPPPPVLHPGTGQPVGPGRPGAAVPDGPDPAGGLERAVRRHPRRGARRLPALAAVARCSARTGWRRRSARRRGSTTSTRASRPAGSHKPNTAVPQAFYNAKAGIRKLTTETGAGQWGTALAFACAQFDLECEVWQVRASYDQKPYRRIMIETFGGTVHPSPSRPDRGRPHDPRAGPRLHRLARASRSARRSRSRPRTRRPTTRSAACSTTC